jgi:hypothetical protein
VPFKGAAQQTITLKRLWVQPQVEVHFGPYRLWFTIKDIEKAMQLLPPSGQAKYGNTAALDTNREYIIELLSGRHLEYRNPLQDIMQNAVGAFLLFRGHAYIETGKRKKLHTILVDIGPVVDMDGYSTVPITVYDPHNHNMIFSGVMNSEMYYKDLGLDAGSF